MLKKTVKYFISTKKAKGFKMNILSAFDGISCARIALERAGIKVDRYFASEIDKYAEQVSQKNWPDIERLGNISFVSGDRLPKIDLLIGGSPCQNLSIAGNRKGLKGGESQLFWEFVRLKKECKPKWFLLENVASMKKADRDIISKEMGCEPIMINSSLVSAQQRKRLYWTNIPVSQPEDKGIILKDIVENKVDDVFYIGCAARGRNIVDGKRKDINGAKTEQRIEFRSDDKTNCLTSVLKDTYVAEFKKPHRIGDIGSTGQASRVYSLYGKSVSLSALGGGGGAKTGLYIVQRPRGFNKGGIKALDGKCPTLGSYNNHLFDGVAIRKLTPIECERLQTIQDGYTEGISNSQRYKALGNGWTVDVIAHILKGIVE